MKTFIIHWHTVFMGHSCRGGYTVVDASDKRSARRAIRSQLRLDRGESLRIESVESR